MEIKENKSIKNTEREENKMKKQIEKETLIKDKMKNLE